MYVYSTFRNKNKNLSNKYIYPLIFQQKNKLNKVISSHAGGSFKSNKLNQSNDSKEILEIFSNYSRRKRESFAIEPKKKISFKYIVQYAREKIKKKFISPYIERLFISKNLNYVKEEDMPIYINLYKINDIFSKKRSRLTTNFYESNIYYSENEYLIKFFKRKEFFIIMRYLLAYIYDKDFYSHYSKYKYKYKNKTVKEKFQNLINNNYILNQSEEKEMSSSERNKNNNTNESFFNIFYQKSSSKHLIKKANLLFLSKYESLKASKIRENYFINNPKYFLIKDCPKNKIPNAIPNYFCLGDYILLLIKQFELKNKFKIFEIKKPEKIETKPNFDLNNESLDIKEKKKKLKNDYEDYSSDTSESYSKDFLNEIYLESSSNDSNLSLKLLSKKISKRNSTIVINNNKLRKKQNENNDMIDVEKLIKNMEVKKENKLIEKRNNTFSNLSKKTLNKKTTLKLKNQGFQIMNTDHFKLYQEYNENANFIQRTFSKKFSNKFLLKQNEDINKILLSNINNSYFSKINSITTYPNILRKNKYFLTSTPLNKYSINSKNYLSNIAKIKGAYKSNKNNLYKYYSNKGSKKALFHFSNSKNKYRNKTNSNYYYQKDIIYPNKFKSKGKIIKQNKISFSIIHTYHKIEFKNTKDFFSGIKKSFKNKKYQKELIKEIISNFGIVHHKRNSSKKNGNLTNTKSLQLNKYKIYRASNIKKYRSNISEHSIKNVRLSTKNEVLRDSIELNGIFKHKKINL